ncbi:class I SAM-dependent methyltransferase [Cohnella mopanensis]|uniref:class I SAM-dependent methyltransferase n=1 Tax=Cohnella mopanensis TaxID=2911966 RepID=UPI001EF8A6FF|nr:class I SAM-dependent methyltransferase [Cohnella mopanensis]
MNVNCRLCGTGLEHLLVDLGSSPLANSFVSLDRLRQMEPTYPLKTFVCSNCYLAQVEEFESPQHIFTDYAYFSSYSDTWLEHCKRYVDMMIDRFSLSPEHEVIEIASNDGYLLQFFKGRGIPVTGIEPAANVAQSALDKGINTITEFFGTELARRMIKENRRADILLGNNVLAHVPDLNDFVAGMKLLLSRDGIITMEFPHLLRLIEDVQFDTIYHEHYSYFSLSTVCILFEKHGLSIVDVEKLDTHGGSLRIFARHIEREDEISNRVKQLLDEEQAYGIKNMNVYDQFHNNVRSLKYDIVKFLTELKLKGKTIVGYGAPAKGNTLLNYCGIDKDYLDYTVDRNPHKQKHYLPGSRIPVDHPEKLKNTRPDYLLILPWNLREEIISQTSFIREWGGKWVVLVPRIEVIE